MLAWTALPLFICFVSLTDLSFAKLCSDSEFVFSGFQAGLRSDATLLPKNDSVLKGYTSLKEGIFALEINVAVLSGQVTLRHGGVYFFSTTVHFSTAVNDTCDTDSKIKVSICIDSDCSGKTSLDAVHGTCDKEFSVTATGLLMLVSKQTVSVHLFSNGSSPLTIGKLSTFSGYLLACT